MSITYTVCSNGSHKFDLDTCWSKDDIEYIVQDAAENFHEHHDGAESTWPLKFEIFVDDVSQGTYLVEREFSPTFSVTEK